MRRTQPSHPDRHAQRHTQIVEQYITVYCSVYCFAVGLKVLVCGPQLQIQFVPTQGMHL